MVNRRGPLVATLKMLGGLVLALTAIWVLYVTVNVLFLSQGELEGRSDAVVSLAPQYHRLATAERLVETGHTETMVISYFEGDVRTAGSGETYTQVPVADYCEGGALMLKLAMRPMVRLFGGPAKNTTKSYEYLSLARPRVQT